MVPVDLVPLVATLTVLWLWYRQQVSTVYLVEKLPAPAWSDWVHQRPFEATIGSGFLAALLSSVMNNMPSVLVSALAIQQTDDMTPLPRDLMVYANVIGCDLGPKFTLIGSLSTLLWLHVPASKNNRVTWGQYMKIGLMSTLAVLALLLPAVSPP